MTTPETLSTGPGATDDGDRILWLRYSPYFGIHLASLAVIWTGTTVWAVALAVLLYFARMFFVTAFYHRYFSHRAFRASRPVQFIFAWLACTAAQRGPMWWAAHHREHHSGSDGPEDAHSPMHVGFWVSHMGWFMQRKNQGFNEGIVKDWMRFPELRWLERNAWVPFTTMLVGIFGLGALLGHLYPSSGIGPWQFLVWGGCISTVAVFHGTYTINSISHLWGTRRYETKDDSRNNFLLALLTLGEGWHNNHHKFPGAARQGFFWWEVDITYYILKAMSLAGIVRDLRPPPKAAFATPGK